MPLNKVTGFKSSAAFEQINAGVQAQPEVSKKANAIFQFDVKNASGAVESWTLNLKSTNSDTGKLVVNGKAAKPDITIAVSDEDFVQLAEGKLNGQKAFMAGKLKVKGNMMLATKLDGVLKSAKSKL